ncbi:hypothetical protein SAMN05216412_104252 [Nitrosospira multiformis]|uniref:Uncharacterized protein n=1 Tax=Nitrosospira multiformis TaxID=1231 RepID=A0A1I0D571_9PROT|nr:hypothetical protein SAMN05216412_104252 [Nitrosospira multiformis]
MNTEARKVWKTIPDKSIACRVHELDWNRIGNDWMRAVCSQRNSPYVGVQCTDRSLLEG